ncbi:hypothetical protein D6850_17745 [Roseovarius spongiae]|uniref:Secreted protein n=1 Tax=Roseovarius spongiae TaxID=2320272 RepID=A0A3A8B1Q4_9RHOB|nr:hypothetical protein [Roseovarius spongiae]RKF12510.1 hypothetical protein D6850_17745 [Roseovarius spongiae]
MRKQITCICSVAVLLLLWLPGVAMAQTCYAPERPFVPTDAEDIREYGDLIRSDFELYIQDIQAYFRCLEEERARAFEEAREVSEDYGRFLQVLGQ